MTPLVVTAKLESGYVSRDPWSPSLDGLLGYAVKYREHGPENFALTANRTSELRPVENLPLLRIEHEGLWWWACSSPMAEVAARDRHYFNRRFDDHLAADLLPGQKKVLTAAGPFKAGRNHETRTVCRSVSWHAVGDPVAIRDLLREVRAVGASRGRGFGSVLEWTVTGDGDRDLALRNRPLPVDYAYANGIEGPVMQAGFRVPVRAPGCSTLCVMPPPTGERARVAA